MLCFTHADVPARGLCKSCSRALCLQCAAEVGKSLACKSRCEADVQVLDEMLRKSVEVTNQSSFDDLAAASRTATSVVTTTEIFNVVLGAIFLAYAAYRPGSSFMAVLGAAFIAFGLFSLVRSRLASRKSKPSPADPQ